MEIYYTYENFMAGMGGQGVGGWEARGYDNNGLQEIQIIIKNKIILYLRVRACLLCLKGN